jgi:hypothetical protein
MRSNLQILDNTLERKHRDEGKGESAANNQPFRSSGFLSDDLSTLGHVDRRAVHPRRLAC